jgi:hypothetical protein
MTYGDLFVEAGALSVSLQARCHSVVSQRPATSLLPRADIWKKMTMMAQQNKTPTSTAYRTYWAELLVS